MIDICLRSAFGPSSLLTVGNLAACAHLGPYSRGSRTVLYLGGTYHYQHRRVLIIVTPPQGAADVL